MRDILSKRKLMTVLLAVALVLSLFPMTALAANTVTEEMQSAAQKLNAVGLFKGTDKGFELEKAPDRVTAFVMLLRLTGKEAECLNGSWEHPFSDVPAWADRYIGYAYEKGLTAGVGGGRFGAADGCTAQMYAVMALRALGYSDSGSSPDFTYATATAAAVDMGIISREQLDACKDDFLRGDLALISSNLMTQTLNGTEIRLIDSLVASGAVRQSDADEAKFGVSGAVGVSQPPAYPEQESVTSKSWAAGWFGGLGKPDGGLYEVVLEPSGVAQGVVLCTWEQYAGYRRYVQSSGFEPGVKVEYLSSSFSGFRGKETVHLQYDGQAEAFDPSTVSALIVSYIPLE